MVTLTGIRFFPPWPNRISSRFAPERSESEYIWGMEKAVGTFGYLDTYIGKVSDSDVIVGLERQLIETIAFIETLSEEQLLYRYAEGKWNIKELLVHLIDAERVFGYRALRFSRLDATPLPGYDEDVFVKNSYASHRPISEILDEMSTVRGSTIALAKSLSAHVIDFIGNANGMQVSPRAYMTAILGHEIHHLQIIRDRYIL
jgi:uncharacterized damage-inducible protein DinB